MRRIYAIWKISLLFIVAPVIAHSQHSASSIVSKYLQSIGGESKWKNIRSIVMTGTYNYGGIQFPFTSYALAPNKYKYIVPSGGKYFAQGYDGSKGWKIDKFKNETVPTILEGPAARAMANEADVEILNPFINSKERGYLIEETGEDTIENNICTKVKLTRPGEDTAFYSFRKIDGQLLKKQTRSKNVEMDGSIIDISYSDYRLEDSLSFARKSVVKVKDQTILVITIDKIVLNSDIPEKEFQP